ncbi:MAG: protein-L-isoaspartate(D-aspartate) O-methyltransferase [Planctomycetes bacterium]|nr:protein-L-isoaspartate(D-aspartate) O-methyltransferase [Planctomycetota bacterium]
MAIQTSVSQEREVSGIHWCDQRERLVDILKQEGVHDSRVIRAMRQVPREAFVPENMQESAYRNSPLSIGLGQTTSQPLIVAVMAEALQIQPQHRVLEIGTGLGYAAAVLAELAQEVFTVERHEALATSAAERLRKSNYAHVHVRHGDGTQGWAEHAPYDGIVVAAASPNLPPPLLEQLRIGGRLVIPYQVTSNHQQLLCLTRVEENKFDRVILCGVQFVPLVSP